MGFLSSIGNVLSNAVEDVPQLATGLSQLAGRIVRDPTSAFSLPEEMAEGLIQAYRPSNLGQTLYEDPLISALDLTGIGMAGYGAYRGAKAAAPRVKAILGDESGAFRNPSRGGPEGHDPIYWGLTEGESIKPVFADELQQLIETQRMSSRGWATPDSGLGRLGLGKAILDTYKGIGDFPTQEGIFAAGVDQYPGWGQADMPINHPPESPEVLNPHPTPEVPPHIRAEMDQTMAAYHDIPESGAPTEYVDPGDAIPAANDLQNAYRESFSPEDSGIVPGNVFEAGLKKAFGENWRELGIDPFSPNVILPVAVAIYGIDTIIDIFQGNKDADSILAPLALSMAIPGRRIQQQLQGGGGGGGTAGAPDIRPGAGGADPLPLDPSTIARDEAARAAMTAQAEARAAKMANIDRLINESASLTEGTVQPWMQELPAEYIRGVQDVEPFNFPEGKGLPSVDEFFAGPFQVRTDSTTWVPFEQGDTAFIDEAAAPVTHGGPIEGWEVRDMEGNWSPAPRPTPGNRWLNRDPDDYFSDVGNATAYGTGAIETHNPMLFPTAPGDFSRQMIQELPSYREVPEGTFDSPSYESYKYRIDPEEAAIFVDDIYNSDPVWDDYDIHDPDFVEWERRKAAESEAMLAETPDFTQYNSMLQWLQSNSPKLFLAVTGGAITLEMAMQLLQSGYSEPEGAVA